MENTRAIYLIEKSSMPNEDKQFLLTHLEVFKDTIDSLNSEMLTLHDTIDYTKALNNQVLTLKEKIVKLNDENDIEELYSKINKILDYVDSL